MQMTVGARVITWSLALLLIVSGAGAPAASGLGDEPDATASHDAAPLTRTAAHGPSGRARVPQSRSGLPWSSGVTPSAISGTAVEQFGIDRGTPVDNVVVYLERRSWATMHSTFWTQALPSYFVPEEDDLVVTLPLWPATNTVRHTGSRSDWLLLGLQIGEVDPDAFVRLGWEMNVAQYPWALKPSNRRAWTRSFVRAAKLITSTCPDCRIVWNPNRGAGGTGLDARAVFPEVRPVVDVYAIDDYDIYPPIKDAASLQHHMHDYGQVTESYVFARRQGLPFALPEWGIACNKPATCQWGGFAGGDNPRYIQVMLGWFRRRANHLAFESYFDNPAPEIRSALYTRPIGPRAGQAYRRGLLDLVAR